MSVFLALENISKYYASAQSVVMGLQNVSLSFSLGEFVAVTGESGSGKSTLAKVVGGILPYESGEMTVEGRPTSHYGQQDWEQYRNRRISYISQSYDILAGCSVLENVVSALVLTGMDKTHAAVRAEEILGQVELLGEKKRRAAKLSSGQKQRLSIARALAKPAPVLVADEPTGNLDRENSAKVVKLLAAAAKERLVIMVTHDFDEVEALATRHITVRDGGIESDVRLREAGEVSAPVQQARGGGRHLSLYTARLMMTSRPVWSAVMVLFFALTAFAMYAFLGTFVVNLDDNFTRIYDDSAFLNGKDTRIVAARRDKGEFTGEDLELLSAVPYVKSVERYGFLPDINYYYREGIDYQLHYRPVTDSSGGLTGMLKEEFTLKGNGLYLQTVPYGAGEEAFLTAGRLPETMYEVVAVGDKGLLGSGLTFYIQDRKHWAADAYIKVTATVVGVTDAGEHLYVSGQLGRVLTGESLFGAVIAPVYDVPEPDPHYTGERSMEGRFLCSPSTQSAILSGIFSEYVRKGWGGLDEWNEYFGIEYSFYNHKDPENPVRLKPYGMHDSSYNQYYLVSPEDFERIVPEGGGGLVSLEIADYAYTDRVLDAVHALGYPAISPYRAGSTKQDEELAAERLRTLKVCILASLAVFLLQIFVLRAMFGMETNEFKLLANLGLSCRTAKASVIWQIFLLTLFGQVLSAAAVACGVGLGSGRLYDILKYLPLRNILLFLLLHLATGLLTFLWIQRLIGAQVYPLAMQDADLEMDEEGAGL